MSSDNEPTKTSGQFKSTVGSIKESLGGLVGSTDMQTTGQKEHAEGEAEIKAAQAKGYAEGTADRAVGYKDSIVGSLTGDKTQQASGNVQNEKGKAQQEVNNPAS